MTYVNERERKESEAETAPFIGQEFTVEERDCCLSVEFTARLIAVEWDADTYTGGAHKGRRFWLFRGYRFDNGVLMADGWHPPEVDAP